MWKVSRAPVQKGLKVREPAKPSGTLIGFWAVAAN